MNEDLMAESDNGHVFCARIIPYAQSVLALSKVPRDRRLSPPLSLKMRFSF